MKNLAFLLVFIIFQNYYYFYKIEKDGVIFISNVTFLSTCRTGEDRLRRILGVSLPDCVKECVLRTHCEALCYRRQMQMCDLFGTAEEAKLVNGQCIYVSATDIKTEKKATPNCSYGQVIDVHSKDCKYKECFSNKIDNGVVLGNVNRIGSKVRYKCNHAYNINGVQRAVCRLDGTWSSAADCLRAPVTNVAMSKPTTMSSVYHGFSGEYGVDGNTKQFFSGKSCFHTLWQNGPWWRVDLGANFSIFSLKLFNRLDCCSNRANNVEVTVGTSLQSMEIVGTVPGQIDDIQTFNFPVGIGARYVQVTLIGLKWLHLCEVQVEGFPLP